MPYLSLNDSDVRDKTVLLRADLNVPISQGEITDVTRIKRLQQTIHHLIAQNCKVVLLSHFGRPQGHYQAEYSLSFLPSELEKQWGVKVGFVEDCIGALAGSAIQAMDPGQVILLENLRFHPGEEKNDSEFTQQLAKLGDFFINDAFSAAHRAHSSTEGLSHYLPAAAGFLMAAELDALNQALENPQKPVMAIVGGAKISTKLALLHNLVQKVNKLVLGGGMANTFLFAAGYELGASLCEKEMASEAREIMKTAESYGCEILLPQDCLIVEKLSQDTDYEIVPTREIPSFMQSVDMGPASISYLREELESCKTVLWNGPLGVFEIKPFDTGTNGVASIVARLTQTGQLISVAGGGDTVAALENAGVASEFSYISTAGGAFLEWLEGKTLPGIAALEQVKKSA